MNEMKCDSTIAWTYDCPSHDADLCSCRISLFSLNILPIYAGFFNELSYENFDKYESGIRIVGYYFAAFNIIWNRPIVPHAFIAICFMKNTSAGTDWGSKVWTYWAL